jgi:alpha-tubulin suppressor-like RCC1 family protein/tRNA A-37 threonylcarbamoyl transferase component Bud32
MLGDTEANVVTTDLESEYEILGELGRGATAVVYRARDRELGREVAIKVIRPKFADDDEAVARLSREARTVAQLGHPNIVTLFAVRRVRDGSLALVMQLVPGRTLREMLNERGPCTFERVDRVIRDVASALAHAHQRGIVHRDVKPENIFIDETTGHAMLSDFGVARSLEPDSQLTATGTAIGTPAYMSPEQIDGTELDGRSDLYSLGLVGWEMLTGRRPWEGEGLYSVIFKQKREELPAIEALRPDTPDRLIYLVEGAIRKNADERWNDAAEMLERASTIAPEGGWARWHAERRKRRRAIVYTAARERGDSVVSAALETVRFRRDGSLPAEAADAATPVPRNSRALTSDGIDTRAASRARLADIVEEQPPRRSLLPVFVVAVLVVSAIGASVRLMRGRTDPRLEPTTASTFADNGGVEVPVGKTQSPAPATPNAATPQSPVPLVAPAPESRTRTTPPAEPGADSASVRASDRATDRTPTRAARTEQATNRTANAASAGEVTRSATQPVTTANRSAPVASATTTAPLPAPPVVPVASLTTPPGTDRSSGPTSVPKAPAGSIVSFPVEHATVAAGGRHSCVLDAAGAARCWGANDQGQLGDGTLDDRTGPAAVAGELAFAQLNAGSSHTCGVTRDGDAYCWGNNERGQLGDATTLQRNTPVRVGASGPFKTVRAGFAHSCALTRAGEISCWGSNAYGQLGTGAGLTSPRPADVAGAMRFGAMAVGWNHTCAITVGGDVYCWGSNNGGQIGDGTRDDRRVPTRVAASVRFVSIAAGNQHTCAVATTGDVYCWGRNNYGQLATGSGDRSQPTRVETTGDFVTVAAGAVHSCAKTTAGQVFCWGRNTFGQLGDGTNVDRPTPVRVASLPAVVVVQASGAHTCAATASGESYCWGYNVEGQLGDGTRNHRSRPVRVAASSQ